MSSDMPLEPVKVFKELSSNIAATKAHFVEYSAGVSKLLNFKDEILRKAVSRKPLSTQQLTNIAVISSSLFLSKAAIEEQLTTVNAVALSSVEQAAKLPSRALLHWMLMAIKLLRRSHVSEHLQIRYRTARMLEIWDLAASSIPASPIPTPRSSISKQGKRPSKQAAATVAAPASALLPPPNAGPSSPGKAQSEELVSKLGTTQPVAVAVGGDAGQNTAAADGGGYQSLASPSGPRNMVETAGGAGSQGASPRPVLTFPTLPSLSATADRSGKVPASASAALVQRTSQEQPSTTSSQQQLDQPLSLQQRDAPLLQINPARLSRSGSQISSSPRDMQSGTAVSQGPESVSEAALAAPASPSLGLLKGASISENVMMAGDDEASQSVPLASGRASLDGTNGIKKSVALFGIKPQQSGTSDLLAAVNAVVGGLSLRHTASLSGAAALSPIAEHSEAGPGGDSAASTSRQHQQEGFTAPAAAAAAPDMFSGMSAAGFRRTRSNLRTGGSLTASVAADLPRAPSLSSNPAGQLSRQVSSRQQAMAYRQPSTNLVSGLSGGVTATDEVDWRS